jgi:hypothetical protein
MCYLELTLNVTILILQDLGLLEDLLSLHPILLLADLVIQPILLHGQKLDVPGDLCSFFFLLLPLLLHF